MNKTNVTPLRWLGDIHNGHLEMLDQRRLPGEELWHKMDSAGQVAAGIKDMIIRGAPAIGIAAAYGVALGMREVQTRSPGAFSQDDDVEPLLDLLAQTRPTAVNLFWALERCRKVLDAYIDRPGDVVDALFDEARAIYDEDRANNLRMGEFGAALLPDGARILTHCNTGGLATGGYGTALGIIRAAHAQGKLAHVWIDETRPYLQGARLTAWECLKEGIDATLITDSMAAHFMKAGGVDAVIVGTDRVAANGDVANKIGTYGLAVLCKYHDIPFYVAAPISTIDLDTPTGDSIPIEQRDAREVTHIGEHQIAPEGINVAHPAFDVTPGELVTAIITEEGVAKAPYQKSLAKLVRGGMVTMI